jgi:GNAT superfamily N-acetyltransferase
MNENYEIKRVEKIEDAMWTLVGGGINDFNNAQAGESHGKSLCFMVYAPDQTMVGGVIGETHWNWLYISLMFVREDLRGQGFGHQLITLAEEEAKRRGATHVYLDTFSFQAPGFYAKHGYEVFGELKDFPPGHQRYYLVKEL